MKDRCFNFTTDKFYINYQLGDWYVIDKKRHDSVHSFHYLVHAFAWIDKQGG